MSPPPNQVRQPIRRDRALLRSPGDPNPNPNPNSNPNPSPNPSQASANYEYSSIFGLGYETLVSYYTLEVLR